MNCGRSLTLTRSILILGSKRRERFWGFVWFWFVSALGALCVFVCFVCFCVFVCFFVCFC